MPKVIGTVTTDGNTTTTQFTGTVTNNAQTFYFDDTQDSMIFSTDGHSELTLKVDGRSYIVRPNVPVEIYEDFSSFNITRKDKGSQSFQLTSYVYADDNHSTVMANVEDVLTSTSGKNALSANQGRVLKGLVDTNTANVTTNTNNIGTLSNLQTTNKTSLVNAVNENVTVLSETTQYSILVGETNVTSKKFKHGDVRRYGAVGNNINDDTNAFKNALTNALVLNIPVYIPDGTFLVTTNIFKITSVKSGLTIIGNGNGVSIINFNPVSISEICIDLSYMSHALLRDFKISGASNKGIGIRIGDPSKTVSSSTYNCDFINIYCRGLDLGIETNYGWINSFLNLKTRFCNKGMISDGGGVTFTNYVSEGNTQYGIKINGGICSFNGSVIETNPKGMIIDGGSITMNDAYFEQNTNGNIDCGVNGTSVSSLIIHGLKTAYYQPYVFDKLDYLEIKGIIDGGKYNDFRISSNVQLVNIEESTEMLSSTIYSQTNNSKKRKVQPIIVNDLSKETTFTNGMSLDKITNSVQLFQNGTVGSLTNFQGKNTFKFLANTGGTFVGFRLKFDFLNAYLKTCKKLKFKSKVYIDHTTFSDIANARHQTYADIQYRDSLNALKTASAAISFNPADATNSYGLKGNHMSMVYTLDLPIITAGIADFVSLEAIQVYFNITSGSPVSAGTETVYFEGIEVYPDTDVKDILSNYSNVNDFGLPVFIAPNGNKYKLSVDNSGVLTTVLLP